MVRNTRVAIQTALAQAYLGATNTAQFMDYCCPIDNSPGNAAYIMANAVQMAKVRAAVNGFKDKNISDWLHLCYGPDVEATQKYQKQQNLAHTVIAKAFNGHYSDKKATRLAAIAWLALEDYRLGVLMSRRLPIGEYLATTDINPTTWSRDWAPRLNEAMSVIADYDRTGISTVAVVVRRVCDSENDK